MIPVFCFRPAFQKGLNFFLLRIRHTVYPLKHLILFIPSPVCTGDIQ